MVLINATFRWPRNQFVRRRASTAEFIGNHRIDARVRTSGIHQNRRPAAQSSWHRHRLVVHPDVKEAVDLPLLQGMNLGVLERAFNAGAGVDDQPTQLRRRFLGATDDTEGVVATSSPTMTMM